MKNQRVLLVVLTVFSPAPPARASLLQHLNADAASLCRRRQTCHCHPASVTCHHRLLHRPAEVSRCPGGAIKVLAPC